MIMLAMVYLNHDYHVTLGLVTLLLVPYVSSNANSGTKFAW